MSDPSIITTAVSEMRARAKVCRTLMGGRAALIAAGETYLPRGAAESIKKWTTRLNQADYFPAFEDAVDTFVGKPLGEPIVVSEVPATIEAALEDVDLEGQDLDSWARQVLASALVDGVTWCVVDYPRVDEGMTLLQEREAGVRPYLVHVPLSSVLGWRTARIGGRIVVTQFRYMEQAEKAKDTYETASVQRVRVWSRDTAGVSCQVFEQQAQSKEWTEVVAESGPCRGINEIPVAAYVPDRRRHWQALPPLEALAWLNITHWQSSSEQRQVLHASRVLLLAADEDARRDGKGSQVNIDQDNLLVGLKGLAYVTMDRGPIETGRQDLLDLVERMRVVAGKVLTRQAGGDKSATEATAEARDGGSKLRRWSRSFQDWLEQVLTLMCKWTGDTAAKPVVAINMDWDDLMDPALFATVLEARLNKEISRTAFLRAAQRQGVIDDPEAEAALLEIEPPDRLTDVANP